MCLKGPGLRQSCLAGAPGPRGWGRGITKGMARGVGVDGQAGEQAQQEGEDRRRRHGCGRCPATIVSKSAECAPPDRALASDSPARPFKSHTYEYLPVYPRSIAGTRTLPYVRVSFTCRQGRELLRDRPRRKTSTTLLARVLYASANLPFTRDPFYFRTLAASSWAHALPTALDVTCPMQLSRGIGVYNHDLGYTRLYVDLVLVVVTRATLGKGHAALSPNASSYHARRLRPPSSSYLRVRVR